jgi:hypothetical protein
MHEAETRANLIDPALKTAGRGVAKASRVRRAVITLGRRQDAGELDETKLPHLIRLKYRAIGDAAAELGSIAAIRNAFIGFQRHLYS